MALGSQKGVVALYATAAGTQVARWHAHGSLPVRSLAFSATHLASGGTDQSIVLYDLASLSRLGTLTGHSSRVWQLRFSPDGKTLASSSYDNTARLWNVSTMMERAVLSHLSWVSTVRFSADGTRVITASDDNTATIWEAELGHEMISLRGHTKTVWDAFFTASGRDVVTVSSDGTIKIWHAADWK